MRNFYLNLDFFFAWGSMSKFCKHWKIEKSEIGDCLTQPVTVQISAHLMPDGTQPRTFRSSSNTCCLGREEVPAPWLGQAQQELWHTVPVWIVSPSLKERALKPTNSHIPRTFWCSARIKTKKVKQSPKSTSYSRLFCQLRDYNITFLNWCK